MMHKEVRWGAPAGLDQLNIHREAIDALAGFSQQAFELPCRHRAGVSLPDQHLGFVVSVESLCTWSAAARMPVEPATVGVLLDAGGAQAPPGIGTAGRGSESELSLRSFGVGADL